MHAKPIFKPTALDHLALESRELLAGSIVSGPHSAISFNVPTANAMANVSQDLNTIYNAYVSNGGNASTFPTAYPKHEFQGNSIGVMVNGTGSFTALIANLKNSGMNITLSNATYDVAVGFIPIASLPTIANLPQTKSISPLLKPSLSTGVTSTITMPNVSQDLNTIYNAFLSDGGDASQFPTIYPKHVFQGNSVGVTINIQGNFNTALTELKNLGMNVTLSSAAYGVIVGYVPIASLTSVSQLPQTRSVSPLLRPAHG